MQVKAFPTHLGNLLITDDFAPPVLQRAISELSRQAIWQYGWRSNARRDRYCYWHAPIAGGGSESRVNCEAGRATTC
jgi:SM-20-related protein